ETMKQGHSLPVASWREESGLGPYLAGLLREQEGIVFRRTPGPQRNGIGCFLGVHVFPRYIWLISRRYHFRRTEYESTATEMRISSRTSCPGLRIFRGGDGC